LRINARQAETLTDRVALFEKLKALGRRSRCQDLRKFSSIALAPLTALHKALGCCSVLTVKEVEEQLAGMGFQMALDLLQVSIDLGKLHSRCLNGQARFRQ